MSRASVRGDRTLVGKLPDPLPLALHIWRLKVPLAGVDTALAYSSARVSEVKMTSLAQCLDLPAPHDASIYMLDRADQLLAV